MMPARVKFVTSSAFVAPEHLQAIMQPQSTAHYASTSVSSAPAVPLHVYMYSTHNSVLASVR
eukprot:m.440468 g.440468  ORF g.440468 m.440468 type:complete len:62 (+) comp20278_c8_seq1:904-1089(+)